MHRLMLFIIALRSGVALAQNSAQSSVGAESTGLPRTLTDPAIDSNVTALANLWGWTGCSSGDKEAVLGGLGESHTVLGSDGCYYIDRHWNDYALVEYLGPPRFMQDFRDNVKENFRNAYSYEQHWADSKDTHIYCHDNSLSQNECANSPNPIIVHNDYQGQGIAIVFCDHWFSLGKLSAAIGNGRGGNNKYDLRSYDNRAVPWISAMFQIKTIGTWPSRNGNPLIALQKIRFPDSPFFQWVTTPAQTKYLSKYYEDELAKAKTWSNPDNWAWYSMAVYVQKKMGEYPQRPLAPKELPPSPIANANMFNGTDGSNVALTDPNEGDMNFLTEAYGLSDNMTAPF